MVCAWTKFNGVCVRLLWKRKGESVSGEGWGWGVGGSHVRADGAGGGFPVCLYFPSTVESPGGQQCLWGYSVTTHPVSHLQTHSIFAASPLSLEHPPLWIPTNLIRRRSAEERKETNHKITFPSHHLSPKMFHFLPLLTFCWRPYPHAKVATLLASCWPQPDLCRLLLSQLWLWCCLKPG